MSNGSAPPEVEALVAEIRAEAAELRRRAGPGGLPPPVERDAALAAVAAGDAGGRSGGAPRLALRRAHLAALAEPGDVVLQSHRARFGRLVVAAKQLLLRLLVPVLDRQGAFNRASIDALEGIAGAAQAGDERLAARLAGLERRFAVIEGAAGGGPSAAPPRPSAAVVAAGYDAREFEARFRGAPGEIRARQERYLPLLLPEPGGPVADLGCGRGEFLDLLRERGVEAWGVEIDEGLAGDGIAAGLAIECGDALGALAARPDGTLGAVVAFQVIEHLGLDDLVRLLALARRKLRPGGRLVLETVNVQSLIAWTRGWSIDPTHRQPVHPLTLRFLAEQAGFRDCEIVYSGEVAAEEALEVGDDADRGSRNARRLNALLFGPQDYALVARA